MAKKPHVAPGCGQCQAFRLDESHKLFNPACLHCGARLIQHQQRCSTQPKETIAKRCRWTLAEWMARGHAEQALRELAKAAAWCVQGSALKA